MRDKFSSRNRTKYHVILISVLFVLISSCSLNVTKEGLDGNWESVDTSIAKIRLSFNRDTLQMIHDLTDNADSDAAKLMLSIEKSNPMSYYNYRISKDTVIYTYQRLPPMLEVKEGVKFYFKVMYLSKDSLALSDNGHVIPFRRSR